jgi:hypothetical protein
VEDENDNLNRSRTKDERSFSEMDALKWHEKCCATFRSRGNHAG